MARTKKLIKRIYIVKLRLTMLEKQVIMTRAKQAGTTLSEFIRKKSLDHRVLPRLNEEEVQWLRKLIGMANNLIAIKANLGDDVKPLLDEINHYIRNLK